MSNKKSLSGVTREKMWVSIALALAAMLLIASTTISALVASRTPSFPDAHSFRAAAQVLKSHDAKFSAMDENTWIMHTVHPVKSRFSLRRVCVAYTSASAHPVQFPLAGDECDASALSTPVTAATVRKWQDSVDYDVETLRSMFDFNVHNVTQFKLVAGWFAQSDGPSGTRSMLKVKDVAPGTVAASVLLSDVPKDTLKATGVSVGQPIVDNCLQARYVVDKPLVVTTRKDMCFPPS